jgi:hypothetical protein
MLRLRTLVGLLSGVYILAPTAGFATGGPATAAYTAQSMKMVFGIALPKVVAHSYGGNRYGLLKLTYRVRANGALESARITDGDPNWFSAQTLISAIRSAKFLPLPKAVLKEQGKNWLDIHAEINVPIG